MPLSKLKNLMITALVILNLSFLAIIVSNRVETIRSDERTRDALISLYSARGVTLSAEIVHDDVSLPSVTLSDPAGEEIEMVRSILGECETSDLGNGIILGDSPSGSAAFHNGGEFHIELSSGIDSGAFSVPGAELQRYGDGYIQYVASFPVFNCTVSVSGERIAGRLVFAASESGSSTALISSDTALTRFLSLCPDIGEKCTVVDGISAGYYMISSFSGGSKLEPVWCISSDAGNYFISGISGLMV